MLKILGVSTFNHKKMLIEIMPNMYYVGDGVNDNTWLPSDKLAFKWIYGMIPVDDEDWRITEEILEYIERHGDEGMEELNREWFDKGFNPDTLRWEN